MDTKNWIPHIEFAVMLITIIGLFFSLDLKIDSKIDGLNARFDQFMFEWKNECKDFHGRLCTIEERNREK